MFNSTEFKTFHDRYVATCSHKVQYIPVILRLLQYLERYGEYTPSVIASESDLEPDKRLSPFTANALSQVSLARHALITAEEAIKYGKPNGQLYLILLITTLGSDAGKIGLARMGCAKRIPHPHASLMAVEPYLKEWLPENPSAREAITTAILNHHRTIEKTTNVARWTKKGGELARVRELHALALDMDKLCVQWERFSPKLHRGPEMTSSYRVLTGSEIKPPWFKTSEFLAYLKPLINSTSVREAIFVLRNGHMYCFLNILFKVFRRLALQYNWREILLYEGDYEKYQECLAFVVKKLVQERAASQDYLRPGRYFDRYTIEYQNGTKREPVYMVRLNVHAFGVDTADLVKMEQCKLGGVAQIKAVRHYRQKS